jgi:[acyl-carrier-protein] S-malonyltransferase
MQRAGEEQPGTMAAVVGLAPDAIEAVCMDASIAGVVQPANFNSPGQIVISGSISGVRAAIELARQRGAKLAKELIVSGAFHSPLMESARSGLKKALDNTPIRDAAIPVYANVTAEPVTRSQEIRTSLFQQLTSPVLWEQSVHNMVRDGASSFVEIGPGRVLQGLVKRTENGVTTAGIDKLNDFPIA